MYLSYKGLKQSFTVQKCILFYSGNLKMYFFGRPTLFCH